jgi:WD40 repeat protein
MVVDLSQHIKDLFDAAFDLAPEAREGFLAESCDGDTALRAEVEKLLRLHDNADEFLEAPPLINDSYDSSPAIHADASLGRRIGAYQVIRELGRGGMGAVFLAHRADQTFEKQVAIKLVWPGLGSEEVLLRFQQERQILARLEHPNIARLLDGGVTEDGWHYLVMEYIAGVPITQYCRQHSMPERLQLFRAVCEAVQFAHQNLVIHRDLKPGNILVTNDGTPKLLDFGIAKLLETNEASLALTHTQLPLTPEYASPEQLNNQAITTATDVYSLGVVLYEILTERKPYHFKSPLLHEVARVVTEVEPDKPNLDDDLTKIVLMAMHKVPTLRYESVAQFKADLDDYWAGKTVLARKPTTGYRVRKFVRRHKLPVTLATLLLLTLVTVAIVSVWQARVAREQARRQRRELYATQMNQAVQDWELGNLARMRATLEGWLSQAGQEDLRGFEWRYLWGLCHPKTVTFQHSATAEHGGLGFYDHDNFIGGSSRTTADLWDAKTGQLLNSIHFSPRQQVYPLWREEGFPVQMREGNKVEVVSLRSGQKQFSLTVPLNISISYEPRLQQIVTSHDDGTVKIWDLPSGNLRESFRCQTTPIDALYFSLDWQKLFTRSAPNEWRMRDMRQGTYQTIKTETAMATPQVSPNSQYFFLQEGGLAVRVFRMSTGQEMGRITVPGERILFAYFSPDSQHLLITSTDSTAKLYQLPSLKQVAVFQSDNDWMPSAFVSPDGKLLLAICGALTVKLWDTATQKEVAVVKGHDAKVIGAQFSHDGTKVLTWSEDGVARIWEVAELLKPDQLTGHRDHIFSVAFAPDGKTLASASKDRSIRIWDAQTGQVLRTLNGHTAWVFAVAFAPDGKTLASGSQDNTLRLWEVATGQELRRFAGHTEPVRSVAFAPDGKRLVTASSDASVRLWEVATGQELMQFKGHKGEVYSVAFLPDGNQLLSAGADDTARLWNARSGQEILRLQGHVADVWAARFSPDGRLIATASADRTIKLWDAATGRETATVRGHANDIFSLAWSPDGSRLATASNDKTVRLWNVQLGLEVLTLRQHNEQVWAVAFSPDGTTLASGSWDKTVRLWRAATPR